MDFVLGLPRTQKGNDSVWVIIDRLTKSMHFLLVRKDYSLEKYADLYVKQIIHLHGILVMITSDRNPNFTTTF